MSIDPAAPQEGALRIELEASGGRLGDVRLANSRPLAARLLVGREVSDALALVPRLFSLCAGAQAIAAAAACRAAGATDLRAPDAGGAELAVASEAAQEHLWRLLLDWPPLLGRPAQREHFVSLYRRLSRPLSTCEPDEIRALGDVLQTTVDLLRAQLPHPLDDDLDPGIAPDEAVPLLPPQSAAAWARRFGGVPDSSFQRAPTLDGQPYETGALARHAGAPSIEDLCARGKRVSARLQARLLDLAECADRLRRPDIEGRPARIDAAPVGASAAVACVSTARGVLLHALRLEHGRIADYAVVAPTEWNFHPQGAFVREARRGPAGPKLACRARALALALDPCVNFDLLVTEAPYA